MTDETAESALNFSDCVTPGVWRPEQLEAFEGLSLDQEFDAIAPIFVYFDADSSTRAKALSGAKILAAHKHPLLTDARPADLLEEKHTPRGLHARYTALLWAIANEVIPGIKAHIDEYGAYTFRLETDSTLLAGDASGTFAYYLNARALRKRLLVALNGPM